MSMPFENEVGLNSISVGLPPIPALAIAGAVGSGPVWASLVSFSELPYHSAEEELPSTIISEHCSRDPLTGASPGKSKTHNWVLL